ncbi:hypothetical protein RHSIM_Rhsim06G0092100 [Rhododendron simsii]|uniref:Uncharacterized protein n=1 Tax=Rhododendron simsii TaxID=118357 RepID=A0A834GV65_RHOSS|nr:hypothetical protein RHSIM_Rhsim06G0092100 [Rhododendron simsii]
MDGAASIESVDKDRDKDKGKGLKDEMGLNGRQPGALLIISHFDSVSAFYGLLNSREQSKRYNPEDMQTKIEGKNCIVTGANSGIGYATAEGLASRGANVYMVCHSKERGEAARSKIQSMIGNENVYLEVFALFCGGMYTIPLTEDLQFSRGNFDGVEQYARNKRIQVRKDRMLFNFIGFH